MALNSEDIKSLIQQLELDRQAYLNSHNKLQQALLSILPNQAEPVPPPPNASIERTPTPYNITVPATNHQRINSFTSQRTIPNSVFSGLHRPVTSVYSAEESSDSEEDESFFVQRPLDQQSYSEDDLRRHITKHQWNDHARVILGSYRKHAKKVGSDLFWDDSRSSSDGNHNHADVYDVDEHGTPMRSKAGESDDGDKSTWEALRLINHDTIRKQAVGRIVIMREPSPFLVAALHLTVKEQFDMDFILKVLIDDETNTTAFVQGHLLPKHQAQRSLVFVFKYHTLVGRGRKPLPWQSHEEDIESKPDHLPISTCSSVVALSLSGQPIRSIRRHSRKSKSPETSHIFDPFAPYHVLSLQCFPDWHSEVNLHETHHHYVNGPDAFLATLLHEYRDAVKRFKDLSKRIAELVTPQKRVIFLSKLRDELLFESESFMYSRRYFWASQTLGLVIDEIEAMISSYKDTFTDEVWSGEHKTLFPGPASTSARYTNWRKKMNGSRKLLDKEMDNLKDILRTCIREQKDIEKLREWLFAGTSVQESRKAVEQAAITVNQGYNIKLLTLVTIFFLPLMFVTSVFGMTNMNPDEGFAHFGIVTAAVCLPTYFLIGIINQPDQFERTVAFIVYPFVWLSTGFKHSSERARKYRDKYIHRKEEDVPVPIMTRANTMASLDFRLSKEVARDRNMSVVDQNFEFPKPELMRTEMVRPDVPERTSTIRFEVPTYSRTSEAPPPEPSPNSSMPELEKPVIEPQPLQQRLTVPASTAGRYERSHSAPTRSLLRRFSNRDGVSKSPV
jgi:hypothetical protein